MPLLPSIHVKYDVGLSTFSLPVKKQIIGSAKLPTGEDALVMDEVTFNVFYPCDPTSKSKYVPWLPRPLSQWVVGFSRFTGMKWWLFWPIVYLFGSTMKIPARDNGKLLQPPQKNEPWPVVIFSHGLAGGRTIYSQLCGKLASEGRVVLAMEHRDGSGPSFAYKSATTGKIEHKYYVRSDSVLFEQTPELGVQLGLRLEQLKFRCIEIYEAFRAVELINEGKTRDINNSGHPGVWEDWKGSLDTDKLSFMGHSFGGATGLHILSSGPPEGYRALPIRKAIFLDPWVEPLPAPGPSPSTLFGGPHTGSAAFNVPLIFINSEQFTVWHSHYARVCNIVKEWTVACKDHPAFVTLVKSRHQAFSDFGVLFPGYRTGAPCIKDSYELSSAFLAGTLPGYFEENKDRLVHELRIDDPEDEKKKRIRAKPTDIIVHDTD